MVVDLLAGPRCGLTVVVRRAVSKLSSMVTADGK
jgi:hypothetical protein